MADSPEIIRTPDGSQTLRLNHNGATYHSHHGAVRESLHVFVKHGLLSLIDADKEELSILEIGFGTGLNAFLTLLEAEKYGRSVFYFALEPYPLEPRITNALEYPEILEASDKRMLFDQLHALPAHAVHQMTPDFSFCRSTETVQDIIPPRSFDVVYYDAFAPVHQEAMWTGEIFEKMHRLMTPGAVLVTFCARGSVKRALRSAGFHVESLPGPPGKREMTKAIRQDHQSQVKH